MLRIRPGQRVVLLIQTGRKVANGNGVLNTVSKIPWTPIITVIGWVTLGLVFYATTRQQLAQHQSQIADIYRTRERMIDQFNLRLERVSTELRAFEERVDRLDTPLARKVEGMGNLQNVLNDRINGVANNINSIQVTFTSRFDQFQKQVEQLEKRQDQMLQALDAQYNALNEHLRQHGTGGIPRR